MKKLNLIAYIGLFFSSFLLMSNVGGRANVSGQGASGAPGEGTCANMGCHDDGTFSPSLELTLTDTNGDPVEEYFPGAEYTVSLTNNAMGAAAYGFQVTSLNTNNEYFGEWTTDSPGSQVTQLTSRTYVEHAGASTSNVLTAKWMIKENDMPGDMVFYAVSNAINNNGSPGGDGTAVATLTIPQAVLSNKNLAEEIGLVIAPNPASDLINIQLDQEFESIMVLNILGKMVIDTNQKTLDISSLAKGTYFVKVKLDNTRIATKKLLKI